MAASRDRILETAMQLAAERGWRGTSLGDIAAAAGVPLAELYRHYRGKRAILGAVVRRADEAMLAAAASQPGGAYGDDEPVRDRLFDVLMARFDALQPWRDGLAAVIRDTLSDPLALARAGLCHGPHVLRSMGLALEAAGLNPNGPKGMIRTRGLTAVYAATLRVWLRDDSPDMSATMAALDKQLARAEKLAGLLRGGFRSRPGHDGAEDHSDAAPAQPAARKKAPQKKAAQKSAGVKAASTPRKKKAAPKKPAARKSAAKKPARKKR